MMYILFSVKLVGLFVVTTIGICVLVDLWELMDIKRGLTMVRKKKEIFKYIYIFQFDEA